MPLPLVSRRLRFRRRLTRVELARDLYAVLTSLKSLHHDSHLVFGSGRGRAVDRPFDRTGLLALWRRLWHPLGLQLHVQLRRGIHSAAAVLFRLSASILQL